MIKYAAIVLLAFTSIRVSAQGNTINPKGDIITTIGGNGIGIYGDNVHDGGPAIDGEIRIPEGLCLDKAGNIYIAESGNNRVRKISTDGIITTIAGTGAHGFSGDNGPATDAELLAPEAVFTDATGNVYVADAGNNRIRKITVSTGIITTIVGSGDAGGVGTGGYSGDGTAATNARLDQPSGLCLDKFGNIYLADYGNNRIRRVDAITGIITTVAGIGTTGYTGGYVGYSGDSGSALNAVFSGTIQVFVDTLENIFICDQYNNAIRRVDASTGIITTIAGTGASGYLGDGSSAIAAQLNQPTGLFVDKQENIFIAEIAAIKRIDGATGIITTVAGNDTLGFSGDGGLAVNAEVVAGDVFLDAYGHIFIADLDNDRIREVFDPTTVDVTVPLLPSSVIVYPNPATNEITIEYAEGGRLIIYNMNGQIVYNTLLFSDKETLNIGFLASGIYPANITDNNRLVKNVRLVKE